MPSVIYLIIVEGDVQSSNLILYPTSSPRGTFISSATRLATDIAATLRGYVQPNFYPLGINPASKQYYVIYVVFPEPVSPMHINILLVAIALIKLYFN